MRSFFSSISFQILLERTNVQTAQFEPLRLKIFTWIKRRQSRTGSTLGEIDFKCESTAPPFLQPKIISKQKSQPIGLRLPTSQSTEVFVTTTNDNASFQEFPAVQYFTF